MTMTAALFARMATPLKPFIDGVHVDTQWFFLPTRLVWDNFVRMMGERPDPDDHNDYTVPQMTAPASVGHLVGSLSDYLTLPTDIPDYSHSSLYHRSYALIWREWYRDENLQDAPVVDMDDGPDDSTDYPLLRRGKHKDYLSGALPFAQKGDAVDLPLGVSAPVVSTGATPLWLDDHATPHEKPLHKTTGTGDIPVTWDTEVGFAKDSDLYFGSETGLETDLTGATAATINDMRVAVTMQHLLERDARGGTRYREQVLAHFGVQTDDIRLMRPELLGTSSTTVNLTPVAVTAETLGAVGDLHAFATASAVGRGWTKRFNEHGIVMGICSIRAELSYQQGMARRFARTSRLDYYWPDLAHLGEQVVESREIYLDGTGDPDLLTGDYSVWGYQPRYEEYRFRNSCITGQFRSTYADSLDIWHLGLDFDTRPVLNAAFIEENPPVSRVVILEDPVAPEFLLDAYFKVKMVRPMPKFGTPGLNRF